MQPNGKIQYSIKVLEDALSKNRRELAFWKSNLTSSDALIVRQAEGNIGSCETRIADLETGLAILCTPKEEPKKEVVKEELKQKPEKKVERVRLNFKSVGKRYGNNIRAIQSHIGENADSVIQSIATTDKYEFTLQGDNPLVITLSSDDFDKSNMFHGLTKDERA